MSRVPNGSRKLKMRKRRSPELSNPVNERDDLLATLSSSNVSIDVNRNFERHMRSVPSEKPTKEIKGCESIATAVLQTSLPAFVNMVVMVTLICGGCCANVRTIRIDSFPYANLVHVGVCIGGNHHVGLSLWLCRSCYCSQRAWLIDSVSLSAMHQVLVGQ